MQIIYVTTACMNYTKNDADGWYSTLFATDVTAACDNIVQQIVTITLFMLC